ncbi:MAG TPA: anti-sigma factor [Terriglobales bacterium]|nr:anti-sigma factor [Terriglobales bacterium]
MTCELWRDQIEPYIDGELASSHDAEVAAHLRTCADCNAFAAEAIHLKRAVATAGHRYEPSVEFRRQIMDSIGARASSGRTLPWRALVFAAMLLFFVTLGVFAWRNRTPDTTREIADIHLNALASANPVDVVSSDMHTVKPWFQGRVPFTFNLPELAGSPYSLAGGRVAYVRGTPCAQLLFQYRLHRISMLIGPANSLGGDSEHSLPNGFHLVRFERNGYAYVTVGDAGLDTLKELSQKMQSAQN